jgi:hypothetical protein
MIPSACLPGTDYRGVVRQFAIDLPVGCPAPVVGMNAPFGVISPACRGLERPCEIDPRMRLPARMSTALPVPVYPIATGSLGVVRRFGSTPRSPASPAWGWAGEPSRAVLGSSLPTPHSSLLTLGPAQPASSLQCLSGSSVSGWSTPRRGSSPRLPSAQPARSLQCLSGSSVSSWSTSRLRASPAWGREDEEARRAGIHLTRHAFTFPRF